MFEDFFNVEQEGHGVVVVAFVAMDDDVLVVFDVIVLCKTQRCCCCCLRYSYGMSRMFLLSVAVGGVASSTLPEVVADCTAALVSTGHSSSLEVVSGVRLQSLRPSHVEEPWQLLRPL